MIYLPTSVEPVKATLSTSSWVERAYPAVGPYPGRMFTTPFGIPASMINSPSLSAVRGVCSAGFNTVVLPDARTGPNFQAAIARGKFQGIIWAHTPTGSFLV